ncbi:MAG TPA: sialate O-acetylesterase, partial [Cellvibrionaceae bacterium]|nr:sialate O-acetylesterase [Cellvibrionaceae bacterium]
MNTPFLRRLIGIAGLISLTAQAAPDPNFHIYLMLGQSNMEGAAPIESQDRVANPRVQVMQGQNCSGVSTQYGQWREALPTLVRCPQNGIGLGPGDTFGRTM